MMKTTQWFPVSTPPTRPGWYEIDLGWGHAFFEGDQLWFDGEGWRTGPNKMRFPCIKGDRWRGLTAPAT